MKICLCEHNQGKGRVYRKLQEEHPEFDVIIKDCVGRCAPCQVTPLALVGEKTIQANDTDELFRKIVAEAQ